MHGALPGSMWQLMRRWIAILHTHVGEKGEGKPALHSFFTLNLEPYQHLVELQGIELTHYLKFTPCTLLPCIVVFALSNLRTMLHPVSSIVT